MNYQDNSYALSQPSVLETNKVLRNTYILLSLSLFFSAGTGYIAMMTEAQPMGFWFFIIGAMGLMFFTQAFSKSFVGLIGMFLFAGFIGYHLGPIINMLLKSVNGAKIVSLSMGGTGAIFLVLSSYALITRKSFSYLKSFIFTGFTVAFLAMIGAYVFDLEALEIVISGSFLLISSAYILYQTSEVINGKETNYIIAAIGLYISIYNIFVSLLHLLSVLSGDD
ncbi:MAG: BAX inhibitor (BI)-1/YccA family protein [Gammaproteobacteria bacterium]|nr:MAG: BAX inhibitor (BI)-1/YccA family protein [Gammaproteobacteria bacterium]